MPPESGGLASPSAAKVAFAAAGFEWRQQAGSRVFWIVVAISCLMVLGSATFEPLRVGPLRTGPLGAASAVVHVHLMWSLFFLFTATAFVADAVLRDETVAFDSVMRAMPVDRAALAAGRFAGAAGALLACFASVPLTLALAPLAPWVDATQAGVLRPHAYLHALGVLAVPNLLVGAAVFFALASTTRSMMAAYLGAVGLLIAYGLGVDAGAQPEAGRLAALLEPFGFAAHALATRGWDATRLERDVPALAGPLLWNRLLWLGVGAAVLAWSLRATRRRANLVPSTVSGPSSAGKWSIPSAMAWPLGKLRRSGLAAESACLIARIRLETGQVVRTPAFAALLLLAMVNAGAALWDTAGANLAATVVTTAPASVTAAMIARLTRAFGLVSIVVAVFYAGELVWNERERGVHELVGVTPAPDWAILLPKVLAIALVLGAILLAGVAVAIGVQAARSGGLGPGLAPERYVWDYLLPRAYDWTLLAVLAVFFQAVSPGKMAGWGWTVLYLIASLTMNRLGLDGSLYRYGGYPSLSGAARPEAAALDGWFRLYWASFAMLLLVLAQAAWGRGAPGRTAARLAAVPARLRGPARALALAAVIVFVATGAHLVRQGAS